MKAGALAVEASTSKRLRVEARTRRASSRRDILPWDEEAGDEDRQAEFQAVALPHMDALYRTAKRLTGSHADAEDLVQEAYLRAFRSFGTFEKETNCRAWLFRILMNLFINERRRSAASRAGVRFDDVKTFVASPEPVEKTLLPVDAPDFSEVLDEEVKQAVEELPEIFRMPLLLAFVEGLRYKEIAQIINCPIGTVMSRLFRGRKLLKKRLAPYARANGYLYASA